MNRIRKTRFDKYVGFKEILTTKHLLVITTSVAKRMSQMKTLIFTTNKISFKSRKQN